MNLFPRLSAGMSGELVTGDMVRRLYSTDASEYQEMPAAVAFPKTEADVQAIIVFAKEHKIGIIPRTAGTSLAGQVVGNGLVGGPFAAF
jgi:FAD/FMN-containing dehydrogenase